MCDEVEWGHVFACSVVERAAEEAVEEDELSDADPAHRFDPVAGVESSVVHDAEIAAACGLREVDVVRIDPPERVGRESLGAEVLLRNSMLF